MIVKLKEQFKTIFNRQDGTTFFSPGRVNLIGEHIDYNGGFVFPCALSDGTYGIAGLRNDLEIHIYSKPFTKKPYIFSLDHIVKDESTKWVDYIKGSIKALLDNGYQISQGLDIYMEGTMPLSAGLSSSASLEMLIIFMINHFFQFNLDPKTMAKLGKEAENKFVGVNSGIMDQFAVIAGKKNQAVLLNTETLDFIYVPLDLKNYQLMIVNTNKKRGLADSKYNERFSECREGLRILKPIYSINNLVDLKVDHLNELKDVLTPLIFKRVKHVITEQNRTIKSREALSHGDIKTFAKLMIQSHESLKDDYEVTGIELDTLQEAMLEAGALGARMTGAGFGGCVVGIALKNNIRLIQARVIETYEKKIGYKPTFYEVSISDGTHLLK